jgi:hypothetical protein
MREILFHGKRIDNGEWVEGFYLNYKNVVHYIIPCDYGGYESWTGDFYVHEWHRVDPATVGQYTGLTDKNGKKIFEGDIIRELNGSMDGIQREVCWDEACMNFNCPLIRKHWAYGYNACGLWLMQSKNIEVIGNIHDNPELLEVDDGESNL